MALKTKVARASRKLGRKLGGANKGYFYRKGRGWHVTTGDHTAEALRDEAGHKLVDPAESDEVKSSFARWLVASKAQAVKAETVTVREVVDAYLDYCKTHNSPSTYRTRADRLFDLCTGLPATYRTKPELTPSEKARVRIHKGYGSLPVSDLTPADITKWIAAHPAWESPRICKQSVKRCFNWAAEPEQALITANPIKALKVGVSGIRTTYFTPEQEQALLQGCLSGQRKNRPMWVAIKVLIGTGMRPGIEFAKLTAKHVEHNERGLVCNLGETKVKGKHRKVYVSKTTNSEVYDLFIEHLKTNPTGRLFRNNRGKPWRARALALAFDRLRVRVPITLDADACVYACRHTYAKRILGGYWSGQSCTIEQLAGLMGNTRDVCWKHYAKWCDAYDEPLWAALG